MAVSDKEFEDLKKEVIELRKKLKESNNKRVSDEESKAEKSFEKIEKVANTLISTFKSFSNWIGSAWGEADDAASKYAKTIGISAKGMDTLRKNTINFVADNSIGAKFNTSMKELVDLQISYNKQIGRSIQMTNEQLSNLAAMKSILGEEQTIKFTANFERFGLDANAAADTFAEMFSNASKKGISLERYSKNFLDNIDLAQKYTFQNGIEGLRRMAEKASAIKLDLQQTASFAEKVNTVEGSIKTGAKLSVLGGPFTQFSNPMGMLYESLNDLESLQDRMAKMTSGFAKWNSETNQVEVSAFNRLRLKAMAEATGQDYGKLMDSVYAQGRRKQVEKQFNARGLSDEVKELVLNTAQIDRKTGQAYVTIDGEKKDINSVTNHDLKALQSINKTQAEDVKDIAVMLRSMTDIRQGAEKQYNALKAQHQDRMGWGEGMKGIMSYFGKANWFLKGILSATMAMATVRTGASFFGSRGAFPLNSGGGARPTGGGSSVTNTTVNTNVSPTMSPMMGAPMMMMGGGARAIGGGGFATGGGMNLAMIQNPKLRADFAKYLNGRGANAPLNTIYQKFEQQLQRDAALALKGSLNTTAAAGTAFKNSSHLINKQAELSYRKSMDPYARMWRGKTHDLYGNKVGFGKGTGVGFKGGFGFSPMGGMIGGMIGSAASMGLHNLAGNEIGGTSSWLRAGADIAQYAGMGAMFGPYGILAGAAIGAVVGGIREGRAVAKKNRLEHLANMGVYLNGDYSPEQLKEILKGASAIPLNSKLHKKLVANGDWDMLKTQLMADGGLIVGKSHAAGGVGVKDSNIEVEGGEFVVNKDATSKNIDGLKAVNNGATIKPTNSNEYSMPIYRIDDLYNKYYQGSSSVELGPLSVDGTIKLDLGNQQAKIDSRELLNNPEFVRGMTDVVTKQINLVENRRFKKDSYFRRM